ncbi:hypothetical protein GIB67_017973 [Kingdonia uniflora]|uniref:Uncharacterized protein n=1 Tax=Kingdonia uniflora TaxID=39325 RepID=A0A7J7N3K4_9MAGN|nr:hypothetical protein GIB67_017973 [Kingdonia uniflora]
MTKHPIISHCRKYSDLSTVRIHANTIRDRIFINSSGISKHPVTSLQKILLHLPIDRMHASITGDRIFPTNVNRSVTDQQVSRRYKSPP